MGRKIPMLDVKSLKKLGKGTVKNVYQHPQNDFQIIKTIQPHLVAADGGFAKHGALKRSVYQGVYRQFRRELLQYLQLCKSHYSQGIFQFPIETPYGLVPTSEGLGLVTEKILAPDGRSWTLEDLAKGPGLERKHHQALHRFFDECERLHIVFGEVNDAGLLYTEARSGCPEFVLVDGIGEKLMVPVRTMSYRLNASYIRKVQKRIEAQLHALGQGG